MSFVSKLFGNGSALRCWDAISGVRGFHMLVRPIVTKESCISIASNSGQNSQQLTPAFNVYQKLLMPFNALVQQIAGFKVKGRLKRRCKDCYIVVRQSRGYVICPTHPRHKQMTMKKRDYKSWILTHATQSKIREY